MEVGVLRGVPAPKLQAHTWQMQLSSMHWTESGQLGHGRRPGSPSLPPHRLRPTRRGKAEPTPASDRSQPPSLCLEVFRLSGSPVPHLWAGGG